MSDDKLDQILAKTIRIETALWPDDGQPGVLSRHSERMDEIQADIDSLKSWRSYLVGAWGAITFAFATWLGIHSKHGG